MQVLFNYFFTRGIKSEISEWKTRNLKLINSRFLFLYSQGDN